MRRGRRRRRDSGRHDRRGLRTRIDPSTTRNCLRRAIELTAEEVRASALVPGPMKTSNLGDGYWTWRESGLAPAGGAVVERHTLADTERPRHPDSALQNSDGITERSAGLVGGDRPSAGPVRELLDATDQAADALAASTKLAGDGPPEGQPGRARRSGRGLQVAGLRRRRGARTRAPPRSHSTSRARISVSRNLWWPPGVTTDPSRPSVAHRFTVLGFTPHIKATCPVVSNRSAPSAVICHAPPFPGREVRSHPGHSRTAALSNPAESPTAEVNHLLCRLRRFDPARHLAFQRPDTAC